MPLWRLARWTSGILHCNSFGMLLPNWVTLRWHQSNDHRNRPWAWKHGPKLKWGYLCYWFRRGVWRLISCNTEQPCYFLKIQKCAHPKTEDRPFQCSTYCNSSSGDWAIWCVSTMPQYQWSDGKLDFLVLSFFYRRRFYLVQWPWLVVCVHDAVLRDRASVKSSERGWLIILLVQSHQSEGFGPEMEWLNLC